MAIDTGKNRVISRIAVAVGTGVPFIVMFPREYWEKLGVMYSEFRRLPIRLGSMAFHTIRGNISRHMIRVGSIIIIRLVTRETF